MAEQQRQVLQQRELDRDETHPQAREVRDRAGVAGDGRSARPASRGRLHLLPSKIPYLWSIIEKFVRFFMHIWKSELGLGVRGAGRARHEASH